MARREFTACGERVVLDELLFERLEAIENPVHQLDQEFSCRLAKDHAGRHAAYVQAQESRTGGPTVSWWIWFDDLSRLVMPGPVCLAIERRPDELDDEMCLLPDGHSGAHWF